MPDVIIAEVTSINNSYEYDENNTIQLFSITVKTISDFLTKEITCTPADINYLKIPLIGEHVIIFRGISQFAKKTDKDYNWYYLNTYSLQSLVNNNKLPGISYNIDGVDNKDLIEKDKSFNEKTISPLQPYEGDIISQGRWGNTIRLGSTVQGGLYSKTPPWQINSLKRKDNNALDGDPIIILSNTKKNKPNKNFVIEDIKEDWSSLWLTSRQYIPNLEDYAHNSDINNYNSQFIGIGDRVVLQSKTDIVSITGKAAVQIISLSSGHRGGGIRIGKAGEDKEGILYSGQVFLAFQALQKIIGSLKVGDSDVSCTELQYITDFNKIITNMTNDNIRIDKKP